MSKDKPARVVVEGHPEKQATPRGTDTVWVPDRLTVECSCGEKIRAGIDFSAGCQRCQTDHTAMVHEVGRVFAKNGMTLRHRNHKAGVSSRAVYKAQEIVHAVEAQETTEDNELSLSAILKDAIIVGRLDLKHLTIDKPLEAKSCWFMGRIDLTYCEFEQPVRFLNCTFYQEFNRGDARESNTIYRKELNCNGSHFKRATSFDGIRVEGNAHFRNSRFEGTVSFINSICGGNVHADGAIFDQEADFTAASFDGNLECSEAEFNGVAKFNSLKCGESTRIDYADFGQEADFTAASVGRNLQCSKAHFWAPAKFNSLNCGNNAQIDNAIFEQEADFTAASFGRNIQCSRARFNGPTYLNSLICGGTMIARRVHFGSEVDARFSSFGLALICDDSTFRGKVDCSRMKCAHYVSFNNTRFESDRSRHKGDRRVVFAQANIGGDLRCEGAVFKGEIDFRALTCDGAGRFEHATFVNNEVVDCRYSYFGGDLDLRSAYFADRVRLSQSDVSNRLRLGRSRFEREVDFAGTNIKILELLEYDFIDYPLRVRKSPKSDSFNDVEYQTIIRDQGELYRILTRETRREVARIVEDLYPFNLFSLILTSTVFERCHGGPNRLLARRLASRFAADQDPTKFSQDPYVQLEKYYDSSGEPYEARSVYYEGRCAVRENAKAYRRSYGEGRVLWPWGRIWFTDFGLKWMTGYGVKARRCVLPLMLLVVVGTIVFWPNNALRPTPSTTPSGTPTSAVASSDLDQPGTKPEASSLAAHAWERFSYSADLALPTVSFQGVSILQAGAANKLVPQGLWREMYAAVHQVVGQLLILLFVATVLGFARRW